jgi:arabinofuranosyltransferase
MRSRGSSPEKREYLFRGVDVRLALALAIVAYGFVLFRTAWVCDDAYFTFRTVDNFVHGRGLTWNVAERVQAYTHPLWMFILSPLYAITGEEYYTSLALSLFLSLATVLLFVYWVSPTRKAALVGVVMLLCSKAFTDYSTSGLENPLTHALLALFFFVYFTRDSRNTKDVFLLSLIASLGVLNRMDTILIFFLPLLFFLRGAGARAWVAAVAGFAPFVIWECFSLLYYGFPFPNTAYAKLNTGIDGGELATQGFRYLLHSLQEDPLTLIVIGFGIAASLLSRERRTIPLALGILLYGAYVVKIGGDFMSGRFLAAPFFCAAVILVRARFRSSTESLLSLLVVFGIGLLSPHPPILSGADYGRGEQWNSVYAVADERMAWYWRHGLLNNLPHRSNVMSHEAIKKEWGRVVLYSAGRQPYWAGPGYHVINEVGLTDPLLARLPIGRNPYWRIGHFGRQMPAGYFESLIVGRNVIQDESLARYYEKLTLIVRGRILDFRRLREIWNMNTGANDHLIDYDSFRYPTMLHVRLEDFETRRMQAESKERGYFFALSIDGIEIDLGELSHAGKLESTLDGRVNYEIVYMKEGKEIASQEVWPDRSMPNHMVEITIEVPGRAVRSGYSRVRIFPITGRHLDLKLFEAIHYKEYYLGHFRLVP